MADTTTRTKRSAARKVSRGPHAERSAAMRKKLIDAAIQCLVEVGYGSTTLQRVTDVAEVSRGAFLHHFPTRAQLMIAVAEFAADEQTRVVREFVGDSFGDKELYQAITAATWEAVRRPAAIAFLEILLGSRSDPEIGNEFAQVVRKLATTHEENVWRVAESIGIKDKEAITTMVHLHQAAMRGLVVDYLFSGELASAERSMELLKGYKEHLTEQLIAEAAED